MRLCRVTRSLLIARSDRRDNLCVLAADRFNPSFVIQRGWPQQNQRIVERTC